MAHPGHAHGLTWPGHEAHCPFGLISPLGEDEFPFHLPVSTLPAKALLRDEAAELRRTELRTLAWNRETPAQAVAAAPGCR